MSWTVLDSGKHEGRSLPEVLFKDPDWFFWAIEVGKFNGKGRLEREAKELDRKARNIKIPSNRKRKLAAEYAVDHPTGKFLDLEIVPKSRPEHEGSTHTFRRPLIDLAIPREIAKYDKLGCRLLISCVKHYLFGSKNKRMTKRRCERFFDDDSNFEL